MTAWTLTLVCVALTAPLGVWLGYLFVLAAASRLGLARARRKRLFEAGPHLRLAVLIPAHDEAALIADTVVSVLCCRYPSDRLKVFVVADNCSDDTARLAREAGAEVFVRRDPGKRGKSHALAFGLARLEQAWNHEAVVFCDADGILAEDYLLRADAGLRAGGGGFHGCCMVADPDRTWFTRLTNHSFVMKSFWQFPGLDLLGLAGPLRGACLAFTTEAMESVRFRPESLTEDLDLSITLMEKGKRVSYDPLALIYTYMPGCPETARNQRERWSMGEAQACSRRLGSMLGQALKGRRWKRVLECLYFCVPPFSVLLFLALLAALAGWGAWALGASPWPGLAAVGVCCLYGGYFFLGLVDTGLSWSRAASLCMIPVYAAWRANIHVRAALRAGRTGLAWIRTPRN